MFALDRRVMAVSEAARQLRIPTATLKNWLDGHVVGDKRYEPVLRVNPAPGTSMTWGEVVEASYLRAYRQGGVSLQKLRPFIVEARELFGVPYPLAHLQPFVGDGRRLLLEAQDVAGLDEDRAGLLVVPVRMWPLRWVTSTRWLRDVDPNPGVVRRC